jgi:predicted RecA/RadA family phage recombinase
MDAVFHQGDEVEVIPYTPSGADVQAGQVVLMGQLVGIATRKIKDGWLGDLNIRGGIYTVTTAGAYARGTTVYWDNTAKKVTTTATSNKVFGSMVEASTGDGDTADVMHMPVLV